MFVMGQKMHTDQVNGSNTSTYTFEVPNKICDNLDALTRRFWWNPSKPNGNFLTVKAQSSLCKLKEGGLGFRSKDFNLALLSKLAWMVASGKESLCMTLLKSKYKVRKDWLRKDPKKMASPIGEQLRMPKNSWNQALALRLEMRNPLTSGWICGYLGLRASNPSPKMIMFLNSQLWLIV